MYAYEETGMESAVEALYRRLGIETPEQIDMADIAEKLDIWIHFEPAAGFAIERNGLRSMILDSRLSPKERWQEFGHELCHLLRHGGNQLLLPDLAVAFQEEKAANFAYHFCVPTFMLLALQLPETIAEAERHVADTFRVRPSFARERLLRFYRQAFGSLVKRQFDSAVQAEQTALRARGIQYTMTTGTSTMLYCRERGVIGYVREEE